jgi:Ca-activated chloride channel family protein
MKLELRAAAVVGIAGMALLSWAASGASAEPKPVPKGPVDEATLQELLKLPHTEVETVRLVLVPAHVLDRRGRVVQDLRSQDFRLFEDQAPQRIEFFSTEGDEPISIAFLLDVSGSMRQSDKLESAKDAVRYLVERLRPADRFALICFADEQVSWVTEFTSDRARFLERLEVQEGYGQTALNDAVAASPELVDLKVKGRKAIILITDGVDNASRLTPEQAVALAGKVDVPIYILGFTALPENLRRKNEDPRGSLAAIRRFSDQTGGALFSVHDPDEMKEAVSQIDQELRHQYLLGYYPTASTWDGAFRRIHLETTRSRLIVRARKGYYATP